MNVYRVRYVGARQTSEPHRARASRLAGRGRRGAAGSLESGCSFAVRSLLCCCYIYRCCPREYLHSDRHCLRLRTAISLAANASRLLERVWKGGEGWVCEWPPEDVAEAEGAPRLPVISSSRHEVVSRAAACVCKQQHANSLGGSTHVCRAEYLRQRGGEALMRKGGLLKRETNETPRERPTQARRSAGFCCAVCVLHTSHMTRCKKHRPEPANLTCHSAFEKTLSLVRTLVDVEKRHVNAAVGRSPKRAL